MKTAVYGSVIAAVLMAVVLSDFCTGFQIAIGSKSYYKSLSSTPPLDRHHGSASGSSHRHIFSSPLPVATSGIQGGAVVVQQQQRSAEHYARTKALHSSARSSSSNESSPDELDVGAIAKYGGALVIQIAIIFGLFTGLDTLVANTDGVQQVPFAANVALFYFLSLKSRIFNPLANTRPQPATLEIEEEEGKTTPKENETTTIRPSWTPPGFIFPIMWLLIIAPIRAVTSAMVYETTGSYACLAIMSLMVHLSIGDVWNTINNVERRYGTAVVGVALVWLSKANAAYQYFQVDPLAGKILGATLIWLSIASALITRTWQLNPDPATGKPEPLYPVKGGKAETRFVWFE